MPDARPTILWFTRDLRLADNSALDAALSDGAPVVAVYVTEPDEVEGGGAAHRWRVAQSLRALGADLAALGGRLILRRGAAPEALAALARETGAARVRFAQSRHPAAVARERSVRAALEPLGVEAVAHPGRWLCAAGWPETKTGGGFKVYTPFWKAVWAGLAPGEPTRAPSRWPTLQAELASETIEALELEAAMRRGAAVLADCALPAGERAAEARLDAFIAHRIAAYKDARNELDQDATSSLSAALALGEISPRLLWTRARAALETRPDAGAGAEHFLKEIVWREFAWHLLEATPHLLTRNWRREWDAFPWRGDSDDAEAWRRGQTGVDVVDAAMRELYVTGVMHNRARMLVASYLTKHLMTDWRVGEAWFRDCLVDFDPASNAMGWQWAAGSGPDAAPYFRIFNPETQAEKFDQSGDYRARWLPERAAAGADLFGRGGVADKTAIGWRFFDAAPRAWRLKRDAARPNPRIALNDGRQRALDAYHSLTKSAKAAADA